MATSTIKTATNSDIEALKKQQAEYEKQLAQQRKEIERLAKKSTSSRSNKTSPLEKTVNSALTSIGRELGRNIVRSIFGTRKK